MFIGQEVNIVELINRALNQNSYGQVYNGKQSLIKENHLLDNVLHKIIAMTETRRPALDGNVGGVYTLDSSETPLLGDQYTTLTFFDLGVVIELNEAGEWIIVECLPSFATNREFYTAMKLKGMPEKIRLDISDDKTHELFDVDGVYSQYHGINVYKDEKGYYTTSNQLQDKSLENIYRFFRLTKILDIDLEPMIRKNQFVEVAKLILEVIGIFYSKELFDLVHRSMSELNATGLVVSYNTSFTNGLLYLKTKRKFTIVPVLGNMAVCIGNNTTPIIFRNLDSDISYNLFYLE